jgi:hypothetical protein
MYGSEAKERKSLNVLQKKNKNITEKLRVLLT